MATLANNSKTGEDGSSSNLFNFSAASSRDETVFAACRPGHSHPREGLLVTPRGKPTSQEAVVEWVEYMKKQGIKRVLCLLTRSELTFYSESLLNSYRTLFDDTNCVETVADIYSKDSRKRILDALTAAENAGEKIVIHCSAGQSRTGACCALWLHHRYKLPVEMAIDEINLYASKSNVYR
jgi:protein tyrosine/serine phosphatase